MTWVCNKCTAPFSVGAPRCPEQTCRARDAHEVGGDPTANVYAAVETTGIQDPGAAWAAVNEAVASIRHGLDQDGRETVSQAESVTAVLTQQGEGELAERLGDVDVTYREPDPSLGRPDDERIGDDLGKVEVDDTETPGQPVPS